MNVYVATSNNPFYNLAVEHWLFKEMLSHTTILYLWQNTPCVVIGRAQNPWRECNIDSLLNDHIPIIRRQSGGGTVYHDLGNLNYTIMAPKQLYDKRKNLEVVVQVLDSIGIQASISSKNDLTTNFQGKDYKISGSAFRETRDRCFQHGTLLVNAEIDKLYQYLHHQIDASLESKGVYSLRSKVINLRDIYPKICIEKIRQAFLNRFHHHITYLPDNLNQPLIIQETQKLKTWEWCFAKTLPFCKKISLEQQNLKFYIQQGSVVKMSENPRFKRLQDWIALKKPSYRKQSFARIPKNFTALEKKSMEILFDTTPEVPNET